MGTESMVLWMMQAELEFILWFLVPTCITGLGEYGTLFPFLCQQLIQLLFVRWVQLKGELTDE